MRPGRDQKPETAGFTGTEAVQWCIWLREKREKDICTGTENRCGEWAECQLQTAGRKNMIHIAIVEDDDMYAGKLRANLERYAEEREEKIRISEFSDGEDIVTNYKGDYDIILMDVRMTFMDGMKAAGRIRECDSMVVIIFITNMPQYAMQGYAVDALDYVLKPVSYFALSQRLDRAIERMRQREHKRYLTVPVKGGMRRLELGRVRYLEVWDHRLFIHMTDEDIETKGAIRDMEEAISSSQFFRCNKCYLVNLEYVEGVQNNDIYIGKDTVRVSRSKKKEFMDALNNYINEVSK